MTSSAGAIATSRQQGGNDCGVNSQQIVSSATRQSSEMRPDPFNYSKMNDVERVVRIIEDAFADVELGEGIGLCEGTGIDDYSSHEELIRLRSHDEKTSWRKLSAIELNENYSSLSFMDAAGMRFHLPAFLIAEIRGEFRHDILFHLCSDNSVACAQFEMLSPLQREAVREYLLLQLSDPAVASLYPMIEEALLNRWHSP